MKRNQKTETTPFQSLRQPATRQGFNALTLPTLATAGCQSLTYTTPARTLHPHLLRLRHRHLLPLRPGRHQRYATTETLVPNNRLTFPNLTLTTGDDAPTAPEPNGSLYLRASGQMYLRISGARVLK